MSHWNHRVVKRMFEGGESCFGIHEVYYDENNKVWAISSEPDEVSGDTLDDLKQTLEWMQASLNAPVLDYDKIPEEGAICP